MSDLRKAAEMAATDLGELISWHGIRDSNDKLMPAHNQTPEIKSAIETLEQLRQALAQPEPMSYVSGFYRGEKISLSRVKLGEKFVLVRTGQIYSKAKDGYWNESEQRPARLHLNCQVQLIKEKNT